MKMAMLGSRNRRRPVVGLLGLLLAVAGCAPPPTALRAVHRFVDADQVEASTYSFGSDWQPVDPEPEQRTQDPRFHVEGIGNDYRYVLANAPSVRLPGILQLRIGADGKIDHVPVLPKAIRNAGEVLVLPKMLVDEQSYQLEPLIVRPVSAYNAVWMPIHMKVPEQYRDKDATVSFEVYGLVWGRTTRVELPEIEVSPNAVLEFSFGVQNPMRVKAAVRFTVDACSNGKCERLEDQQVAAAANDPERPWRDSRIDLARFAGRKTHFVFETEVQDVQGAKAFPRVFPLWAQPTVYEKSVQPPEQAVPRVILISLDTLSARHLELYGYGQATAPQTTAAFARRGTIFDNCVAAGTATVPSHMSMFTGFYPIENNMTDGSSPVAVGAIPVAAVARRQGIETAAFTEDAWVSVDLGYGRGFDQFLENRSLSSMTPEGHAASTFGAAKNWLSKNKDKSFFLFIHTYQVHNPYLPLEAYRGLFESPETDRIAGTPPEQVASRIAYDQEIRGVDDEIAGLLKQIDDLKLSDSTLVILTSDHGEQFGEHGYIQHSNYAYEEVLHVPLMMIGPGVAGGARVPTLVGHVDFRPTILDFLGVRDEAVGLRGRSLRPLMSKRTNAVGWEDRVMFSESWGTAAVTPQEEVELFDPPAFAARKGLLKVARYRDGDTYRYEGFDLSGDPHERNNLIETDPARFLELRQKLDAYESEANEGRKRLQDQREGGSSAAPIKLDPEQEQKLKALGYLQ